MVPLVSGRGYIWKGAHVLEFDMLKHYFALFLIVIDDTLDLIAAQCPSNHSAHLRFNHAKRKTINIRITRTQMINNFQPKDIKEEISAWIY